METLSKSDINLIKSLEEDGFIYTARYIAKYGSSEILPVPFLVDSEEEAELLYKDALENGYKIPTWSGGKDKLL